MYVNLSLDYAIRNEANASFLIRVDRIINKESDFSSFCIPPFIGYILAHIGDCEYEHSVERLSQKLGVQANAIKHFVRQLINNTEKKKFQISEELSVILPCNLLLQSDTKSEANVYEEEGVDGLAEYSIQRPSYPFSVNLMVTTNCTTDCIYCYANRKLGSQLNTEQMLSLIEELHDNGAVNLSLTGGDIFARPDWKVVLKKVRDVGYRPFLSTKTPITEEDVHYLRNLGYEEIQFSLDSEIPSILKSMVRMSPEYIEKVKAFFRCCSEQGLNVLVRSVLTSYNSAPQQIESFYEFLKQYDCVKEWVMTPAFFSQYKKTSIGRLKFQTTT